jgi:hypothetical protein
MTYRITSALFLDNTDIVDCPSTFVLELDSEDDHRDLAITMEHHDESTQLHIAGAPDDAWRWCMRNRDAVVNVLELARMSVSGRFVAKTKAVAEAVEDMRGAAE